MSTWLSSQLKAAPALSFTPVVRPVVQRKCACGGTPGPDGECEQCRRHRLSAMARGATAPPIVHEVLRSSGQALDSGVRAAMETRFGHDFSRVRVHADARAAESAKAINARAYARGDNIVFAAGEFAPQSNAGRKLLAHELAHVVQQSSVAGPATSGLDSLGIGAARGSAENEADRMAAGGAFAARGGSGSLIQRQMEGAQPAMNPAEEGLEGAEKMGGDCTTGCAALESMRNSVKHLCELAGEKDRRCIEGRKKLAAAEGKIIGMGCKCAMPIV